MKVMNIEIYTIDSLNSGANFSSKISSFNVCIWYLSNDMFNLFSAAIFYIHTRKITLYNHQLPQNGFKVRKYYHSFRRCLCDCSISFSHLIKLLYVVIYISFFFSSFQLIIKFSKHSEDKSLFVDFFKLNFDKKLKPVINNQILFYFANCLLHTECLVGFWRLLCIVKDFMDLCE